MYRSCNSFWYKKELVTLSICQPFGYIWRHFFKLILYFLRLQVNTLLNWGDFFKQMLSKNYKILNIDNTISPGHWANVTK
jgi:hypothetical protein